MLARLWWKDARLFWPVWLLMALSAAVAQWFVVRYWQQDARTGLLGLMAASWAMLYGCAVSAASIAGEKENRTLGFLDASGLGRRSFWAGKASFAVLSTLALGALILGLAMAGTERWATGGVNFWLVVAACAAGVLEVLGWGMLWSAVTGNVLLSAVLAVASLFLVSTILPAHQGFEPGHLVEAAPWRLIIAIVTLAVSYRLVVRSEPGQAGRAQRQRAVMVLAADSPTDVVHPDREHWRPAALALAWQARRELGRVWWVIALSYAAAFLLRLLVNDRESLALSRFVFSLLVGLFAGISVFGVEQPGRTYRFLTNHGVRPRLVWLVKSLVWTAGMLGLAILIIVAVLLIDMKMVEPTQKNPGPITIPVAFLITGPVGLLCGMTIRRSITAALVGVIATFAFAMPFVAIYQEGMIAPWFALTLPIVCLFASWAWAGDWMEERAGARRWVKLAFLLVCSFAAAFVIYITHRVYEIPSADSVALPVKPRPVVMSSAVEPYNAAPVYVAMLDGLESAGDKVTDRVIATWLGALRSAAVLPECRFPETDRGTLFQSSNARSFEPLFSLLARSCKSHLEKGDLDGAWEDLITQLRMFRHFAHARRGLAGAGDLLLEQKVLGQALAWAGDRRQTPERLKKALAEYRSLPEMPSNGEIVAAEAALMDRTLDLPPTSLAERIEALSLLQAGPIGGSPPMKAELMVTPWEIARARRVFRLLFADLAAQLSSQPPGTVDRSLNARQSWNTRLQLAGPGASPTVMPETADLSWYRQTTPLARFYYPDLNGVLYQNQLNEAFRRGLLQVLGLRYWQITHDGKLPEVLQALVHDQILTSLPLDPFRNHIYGWVPSEGWPLPPLGSVRSPGGSWSIGDPVPTDTEGMRILYSVGPDGADDGGTSNVMIYDYGGTGDLTFPLPDRPGAVPIKPRKREPVPMPMPMPGGMMMMGGAAAGAPAPDENPDDPTRPPE